MWYYRIIRKMRRLAGLASKPCSWIRELARYGMEIGDGCSISADVEFEEAWASHIKLGREVTVARGARFVSHDACMWRALGASRVGVIEIGDRAFIGAFSIIMPNVRIGCDAVIGAGSVVTRDIPDGAVAAGNPARPLTTTNELRRKTLQKLENSPCFSEEYRLKRGGTVDMRKAMLRQMPKGECFILSDERIRIRQPGALDGT